MADRVEDILNGLSTPERQVAVTGSFSLGSIFSSIPWWFWLVVTGGIGAYLYFYVYKKKKGEVEPIDEKEKGK